jgi:hypothetical protein
MASGKAIDEQYKDCWAPRPSLSSTATAPSGQHTPPSNAQSRFDFDDDFDPNDVPVSHPVNRGLGQIKAGRGGLRPPDSDEDDDYM